MNPSHAPLLCSLLLLAACAGPTPTMTPHRQAAADFSGSWEMNYARSERAGDKIEAMYQKQQRELEKRAKGAYREPAIEFNDSLDNPVASLLPLARFAEMITMSTIVEITQSDTSIEIARNDDFTLDCDFLRKTIDLEKDPLGSERCGWDGRDLVIQIVLPGRLVIVERLTVASNHQELRIQTAVSSGDGNRRFTLDKYFYRFDPPPEDYDCQYTLTRGNVCSRNKPP